MTIKGRHDDEMKCLRDSARSAFESILADSAFADAVEFARDNRGLLGNEPYSLSVASEHLPDAHRAAGKLSRAGVILEVSAARAPSPLPSA